jgi:hypothetical protein
VSIVLVRLVLCHRHTLLAFTGRKPGVPVEDSIDVLSAGEDIGRGNILKEARNDEKITRLRWVNDVFKPLPLVVRDLVTTECGD